MTAKIKIHNSIRLWRTPLIQILIFVFCCLLFVGSCRERVVPPDIPHYVPPIVLTAEDVGVTDAFIRLKFLDTSNVQAKIFLLTRDGKPLITAHRVLEWVILYLLEHASKNFQTEILFVS
ncbi:MAG: hypothetical protein Q8K98_00665 [Bacteroidota bacterium]|nr:hypothetical protein [Bacteroidota bacterium]